MTGSILELLAFAVLAAASAALAVIDVRTKRLPDRIVFPTFGVLLLLFTGAALVAHDLAPLWRALGGAAASVALYLVIALLSRGGMGLGDVKLAAVLGLAMAWMGWGALIVGTVSGFVLGGAFGLSALALRRVGRHTAVPFGPWMLLGAWIGILAGGAIWGWYAALVGLPPGR